tara:strand:+ start:34 stop:678 length:645 start_codon:yes stop_codon:yes gene_type:complete
MLQTKQQKNNIVMEFTKDSIVTSICGIDSNITIEKLVKAFGLDIEEVIETINNDNGFQGDNLEDFSFDGKEFTLSYTDDDGVTDFLENCFGEKYLMMFSRRFHYAHYDDFSIPPGALGSKNLVLSVIEGDGKEIFSTITKGHCENNIEIINDSNFLTDEENKESDIFEKDDSEYEACFDAKNCWYFIKKNEFNKDKWWLGWTKQDLDKNPCNET